ncbi:MAG: hypothetical protein AB8H86_33395 [Polyangiales bacterium]
MRHFAPLMIVASFAMPSIAFASGGGGVEKDSLLTIVGFFLGVAAAYLLANLVIDKLQQRILMLSGVEYIVLGLLLGYFGIVEDLTGLMPIIALAAGWVGLLRGMELHLESLRDRPDGTLRIVLLHHLVPGTLVGGTAYWAFTTPELFDRPWRESAAVALMLGCCAAADSAQPVDVVAKRYKIEGELAGRLRAAARIGDVFVILVFGLVFALFHAPPGATEGMDLTWTAEWSVLQLGLGLLLGAFFTPFLGGNETPNGRFLAMVGIITFASGAAYFLDLSPLAVNVCLGIVLVNVARTGKVMVETLVSTEKPMMLMLLVLAGALWKAPPLTYTVGVFGAFVLLRLFGKFVASRLAALGMSDMRKDLFRGLLAHGDVTVAMAVSFQVVFDGPLVDLGYTVVLASVVLHDLTSPRMLRGLLVDAGDIRRERTAKAVESHA